MKFSGKKNAPKRKGNRGGNTKTCLNWPQTDERRKQGFHEKVELDWYKSILSTVCDENLTWRGSIWDPFPHSGLP